MKHQRARTLLQAYADHQSGWFQRILVARHIARCPQCLAELDALQTMRTALRTSLPSHRAPPGLAARIGSALPREAPPVTRPGFRVAGFAGSSLAGAIAGVALTLLITHRPAPDPLIADVIGDHIRSLMENHLTDVETSNQHTVKPWLSARLDLSPAVNDYAAQGFPLIGGRLDYVDGHRAAAVVYHHDKHIINLFAFVSNRPDDRTLRETSRDGFYVISWRMGGLEYLAVSDVESDQLLAFARLVEGG